MLAAGSWHVPVFFTAAPDSEAFHPFPGYWHIAGACSQLTCPDPSSTSFCIPAPQKPNPTTRTVCLHPFWGDATIKYFTWAAVCAPSTRKRFDSTHKTIKLYLCPPFQQTLCQRHCSYSRTAQARVAVGQSCFSHLPPYKAALASGWSATPLTDTTGEWGKGSTPPAPSAGCTALWSFCQRRHLLRACARLLYSSRRLVCEPGCPAQWLRNPVPFFTEINGAELQN